MFVIATQFALAIVKYQKINYVRTFIIVVLFS